MMAADDFESSSDENIMNGICDNGMGTMSCNMDNSSDV